MLQQSTLALAGFQPSARNHYRNEERGTPRVVFNEGQQIESVVLAEY